MIAVGISFSGNWNGPKLIAAIADHDRQTVGAMPCSRQMIGRGL
jgi:hypothetical protein